MQYPYLVLLYVTGTILTLLAGIVIIYFLLKLFNKEIKFLTVLTFILLYEICAAIVYSTTLWYAFASPLIHLILLGAILFVIFFLITKKAFHIKWWKSLVLFLLITFIIFPFLNYGVAYSQFKTTNFSVFSIENAKMNNQMFEQGNGALASELSVPLPFQILDKIDTGMFSWANNDIRKIIISASLPPTN